MKTVGNPEVLRSLLDGLRRVRPDSQRRRGVLTAHQMLCHLGDASAMVLGERPRNAPARMRRRRVVKALVLWSALPWPHGWPTNPQHNPMVAGTQPSSFSSDLQRVSVGLERIATASADTLEPVHGFFGVMTVRDWQRCVPAHNSSPKAIRHSPEQRRLTPACSRRRMVQASDSAAGEAGR
jgi:hypothetical protein